MDIKSLFIGTSTYNTVCLDFKTKTQAHAYLIVCQDEVFLRDYLKLLAAAALDAKENSRVYRLIIEEKFADCDFYPNAQFSALNVAFAAETLRKSTLAPLESQRRVIIIDGAQAMNTAAQNKLLKLLEEPPKHLNFIMGATNERLILPTVKSRLKTLHINGYEKDELINWLINLGCKKGDAETACAAANYSAGIALKICKDANFPAVRSLCKDIVSGAANITNSEYFANKIAQFYESTNILGVLKTFFRDILTLHTNRSDLLINKDCESELSAATKIYSQGAAVNAIEKIVEAEKSLFYSANVDMQAKNLVLEMLKGKHLWQKL